MALQVTKTTDSGVTTTYYRIILFMGDLMNGQTICQVGAYLDEEARRALKKPVSVSEYRFTGADNPLTLEAMKTKDPIALIYPALLAHPDFKDAQNA